MCATRGRSVNHSTAANLLFVSVADLEREREIERERELGVLQIKMQRSHDLRRCDWR